MEQFKRFLAEYSDAMRAGDQSVLRQTLPSDVIADHFAFLIQMNQSFFNEVAAAGVQPEIRRAGDCFVASYVLQGENGSETMDRQFWWHQDRWVSFDPNETIGI